MFYLLCRKYSLNGALFPHLFLQVFPSLCVRVNEQGVDMFSVWEV